MTDSNSQCPMNDLMLMRGAAVTVGAVALTLLYSAYQKNFKNQHENKEKNENQQGDVAVDSTYSFIGKNPKNR